MTAFLARRERFERVGSTNDVVRDWLAEGSAEVCLAVADEQTAGRGRSGRSWAGPPGRALLLSLGFRPTWLEPERAWRLAAVASMAMAEAAEQNAALPDRAIRLKWPNDLVLETDPAGLRKLGGVLGETGGLGSPDPRVVIGLGVNTDWPSDAFPPELAGSMTSLHAVSGGRSIDGAALLDAFLERLEAGIEGLRDGRFDAATWADRQVTNGRMVRLERPEGSETVRAIGVDGSTGALIVEASGAPGGRRQVHVGEISHVRLTAAAAAGV